MNEGSALTGLIFKMTGTLTGDTQMLRVVHSTAVSAVIDGINLIAINVIDSTFTLDMVLVDGSAGTPQVILQSYDAYIYRSGGTPNSASRSVGLVGSAAAIFYGGRITPRSGQAASVVSAVSGGLAGSLRLYGTVLDTGATTTLVNSGSSTVQVFGVSYDTSSGTITDPAVRASSVTYSQGPKDLVGAGAPEAVVTAPVGSTYRRTDGGAGTSFCVKESGTGNTGWVCK
jgi:hypothetical protein